MSPDEYQKFKERLGLKHEDLAVLLGIHPVASRRYATNRDTPLYIEHLLTLIERLGVTASRSILFPKRQLK